MKNKKGRLIMLGIVVLIIASVGVLIIYRKTSILRQSMRNIEYFTITQRNTHEDNFEIIVDDMEIIKKFYDSIQSTVTRRVLFPDHTRSMRADPKWVIQIQYQNGRTDEIFVMRDGLFYRWISMSERFETPFVFGDNIDLPVLIQSVFYEQKSYDAPRFQEVQISEERWNGAERIHISNDEFSFLMGKEVHTREEAVNVANIIIETERNDNALMEHSGDFDLYRRDFFDRFELMLIEQDKDAGLWIFSFWVNDIRVHSSSLRVAFNGNTGEVVKMWIE